MLLVILVHGLLIEVLIRELKRDRFTKRESAEALLVYFLPRAASPARDLSTAEGSAKASPRSGVFRRSAPVEPARSASATPPVEAMPATPTIDWQHELQLSAQNSLADDKKEKSYRDLAKSMSPSQLDWLKQHQTEPASPGLTWKTPRVEVTKDGLPIVHINDHCVLVPLLFVPMVFCSIGHIEPNGELFKHMRDPKPP